MKAAILYGPGNSDAFAIEDIAIPECGSGDVLIRVGACGVSYRDVVERNGTYRRDVTFPLVIGLEISGTIEGVGDGVANLSIGDHVCTKAFSSCGNCRLCRSGRETTCRSRKPVRGGYAEFVVLPQDACVPVPPGIAFEKSCGLGPGAGVALNAIRDTAAVRIGETVLVTGASGGVGSPAVQIAKASGARVIAVSRSPQKVPFIEALGADEVVLAEAGKDFSEKIHELTGGEGVDVVIDTIGSAVFDAAFNSLAVHGRYAVVGQLTGDKTELNLARIFFKRAALLGVGSVSSAQLTDAVTLLVNGTVNPRIDRILPLDHAAHAHRVVESGQATGRVVLKP